MMLLLESDVPIITSSMMLLLEPDDPIITSGISFIHDNSMIFHDVTDESDVPIMFHDVIIGAG